MTIKDKINAKIKNAGLYYDGHYRHYAFRVELETRGGGASIEFPVERTEEFMEMFKNDLDLENGVFASGLSGIAVVLGTEARFGKIIAIGNILAAEDEFMDLTKDGK